MRTTTASNHKDRLSDRLAWAVRSGRINRRKHAEILEQVQREVWEDPIFAKVPGWVRTMLRAEFRMLMQQQYEHLRWGYETPRGVITRWDELSEDERDAVKEGVLAGKHYWLRELPDSFTEPNAEGVIVKRYLISRDHY